MPRIAAWTVPSPEPTFTPTELDTRLLPDILSHKYALVILAGNPGDGKTAFLQQLVLRLGFQGEILPLNHWILKHNGWAFECVLDGSAADSERGLTSDEVLDVLFAPLEEAGDIPDLGESIQRTQLLAINDGRLLEYLTDRAEDDSWVVHHLLMLLGEEPGHPHPEITLVDLNRRSLVSGEAGQNSAFDAVLDCPSARWMGTSSLDRGAMAYLPPMSCCACLSCTI